MSETFTFANLTKTAAHGLSTNTGIVEQSRQFESTDRILMARALVTNSDENRVPVRLLNVHNEVKSLSKGAMKEQECEFCDFTSEKHSNVVRHMKRAHKGLMEQPTPLVRHPPVDISVNRTDEGKAKMPFGCETDLQVSESERGEDVPGCFVVEKQQQGTVVDSGKEDLLAGRMFRKRTQPMLPGEQSFDYTASKTVPSRMNTFTQTDDLVVVRKSNVMYLPKLSSPPRCPRRQ
jgi:hypothetical protein